jgi:DNA-binding LytR/AlgR family response regulator
MRINCIVVDDEPLARDLLEKYIRDVPALQLVALCNNAFEATEALMQHEVHLIFLDINMPKLSGMKFYRSLAHPPPVIFTTAYPEYAIEGFEVDASDYLVKPFSFERFYQAVGRVLEKRKKNTTASNERYILLKADKKVHRVRMNDILFAEGLGDYIKVHLKDAFLVVHNTLKNFTDALPESFIRVHKSWMVSIDHIEYIDGNTAKIKEFEIPIGLKYKDEFMQALGDRNGDRVRNPGQGKVS